MIYALLILAQIGASAGNDFSGTEDALIEIRSVANVPEGRTVLLTDWTIPTKLDHRKYDNDQLVILTGPPGEYLIQQRVITAPTEGDVIKLPVSQESAAYKVVITAIRARPPPEDPVKPDPTTDKVSKITYIYEREKGTVPRDVAAKFRELNAAGVIEATAIDRDVKDGTGQIPDQYAAAITAAKGKEPCFVVQSEAKVVRVVSTLAEALK